jgi:hypothetical protein
VGHVARAVEMSNVIRILAGTHEWKDHLEDLHVDNRAMLK